MEQDDDLDKSFFPKGGAVSLLMHRLILPSVCLIQASVAPYQLCVLSLMLLRQKSAGHPPHEEVREIIEGLRRNVKEAVDVIDSWVFIFESLLNHQFADFQDFMSHLPTDQQVIRDEGFKYSVSIAVQDSFEAWQAGIKECEQALMQFIPVKNSLSEILSNLDKLLD